MTLTSSRSALSSALQSYLQAIETSTYLSAQSFAEEIAAAQAAVEAATTALYVVYYFEIADIKDEIYMLTHYKAKNARGQEKEPKPRLDELTITADEDEILNKLMKDAARDVYKVIYPYGKNITSGYLYDEAVTEPVEYNDATVYNEGDLFYVDDQLYYTLADDTPADTDPADTDYFAPVGEWYNTYKKIIYTLNYNSNMDSSMIPVLNEDIQDAILKHCLLGWYKTIREIDMIPLSAEEYEDSISKVRRSLWSEIVPSRRRTEIL